MAARNSGIPAPVREDVTSNFRKGGRMFGERGHGVGDARFQFGRLDLIGLGEHDLIAHGRFVERLQHVEIDLLEAMPRIDQHIDPRQAAAALQEFVDQRGP